tara:strand:- start:28862 stop:29434 length:573 start_codon:yes stop_codon:yes gene_type:complete
MLDNTDYTNFRKALQKFGRTVTQTAKKNLAQQKVNASGNLSRSIKYRTYVGKDGIDLNILMDYYGTFIDLGVKGANPNEIYKNNPDKKGKQRAPYSPYSYKDKMPPPSKLDKWSIRRKIAPRDEKGRFVTRKAVDYSIAKSIYFQGISPTMFFTKAFDFAYKGFGEAIGQAIGKDVADYIKKEYKKTKIK